MVSPNVTLAGNVMVFALLDVSTKYPLLAVIVALLLAIFQINDDPVLPLLPLVSVVISMFELFAGALLKITLATFTLYELRNKVTPL